MIFNDAMWAKYEIGKASKVKDNDGNWATHNPFAAPTRPARTPSAAATERPNANAAADRPQPYVTWFTSHGHIVLGCDLATRGQAGLIARRIKGDYQTIYEELKANLLPGVILQPTGVYAVHRAQEAGCTYIRST